MNDRHVFDKLSAYLDGELRHPERVERHVAACPDCAARLRQLRALSQRVGELSEPEVAPEFSADVWQRLENTPRRARRMVHTRIAWAAAAALLVAAVFALYRAVLPPQEVARPEVARHGYRTDEAVIEALRQAIESDHAPEEWLLADGQTGLELPAEDGIVELGAEAFLMALAAAAEPGFEPAPMAGAPYAELANLGTEEAEILSELLGTYLQTLQNRS